ncbi:hypothetical protein HAX54_047149 [Datura stramonium]|uniref:Uncharacterized protein n=1 Tax=Datura stramonium TaxID=4076 RepID=A0ABS8SS58_DATST|nr:hypothetical protein [Datura stramonium]
MTNSHESQLQKLARSLPTLIAQIVKWELKSMYESLTTLCKWVDAVEGAVTSLRIEVREWKSWTPMEVPDMSALDTAIASLPLFEAQLMICLKAWGITPRSGRGTKYSLSVEDEFLLGGH